MAAASSSSSSASSSGFDSEASNSTLKRKFRASDSDSDSESDVSSSNSNSGKNKIPKKSASRSQREKELESNDDDDSDAEEEVQVLSHKAQRRLKKTEKKLSKTAAVDADESEPSKSKLNFNKKKSKEENAEMRDVQPRRQNSVWVGNLSFKTTPDSIRTFFEGVGDITRINMPMKVGAAKNENRGFAYVDFATPDAKTIAITMSESHLEGRRLLIKDGDDFTGRPAPPATAVSESTNGAAAAQSQPQSSTPGLSKSAQKILAAQKQPPCPCLFIGNLGFEATEEKIRQMIEGHAKALAKRGKGKDKEKGDGKGKGKDADKGEGSGEKVDVDEEEGVDVGLRKVRMGTFEDSGLCKGFAFIDFTSVTHATAALTNPRNHFLDGRKLVVEYASADAARRGGYREGGRVRSGGKGPGKPGEAGKQKFREGDGSPRKKRRMDGGSVAVEGGKDENTQELSGRPFRKPRKDERNTRSKPERRAKPGAALALAKRESAAIVPSQGTRMTFT